MDIDEYLRKENYRDLYNSLVCGDEYPRFSYGDSFRHEEKGNTFSVKFTVGSEQRGTFCYLFVLGDNKIGIVLPYNAKSIAKIQMWARGVKSPFSKQLEYRYFNFLNNGCNLKSTHFLPIEDLEWFLERLLRQGYRYDEMNANRNYYYLKNRMWRCGVEIRHERFYPE